MTVCSHIYCKDCAAMMAGDCSLCRQPFRLRDVQPPGMLPALSNGCGSSLQILVRFMTEFSSADHNGRAVIPTAGTLKLLYDCCIGGGLFSQEQMLLIATPTTRVALLRLLARTKFDDSLAVPAET